MTGRLAPWPNSVDETPGCVPSVSPSVGFIRAWELGGVDDRRGLIRLSRGAGLRPGAHQDLFSVHGDVELDLEMRRATRRDGDRARGRAAASALGGEQVVACRHGVEAKRALGIADRAAAQVDELDRMLPAPPFSGDPRLCRQSIGRRGRGERWSSSHQYHAQERAEPTRTLDP
jgi:hypothetical protein